MLTKQCPYTMSAESSLVVPNVQITCPTCGVIFQGLPIILRPVSGVVMDGAAGHKKRMFEVLAMGKIACIHLHAMRWALMLSPLHFRREKNDVVFYPYIFAGPPQFPTERYGMSN